MKIKNVIIEKANFNLNKNNHDFFIKLLDSDFENIKLEILDSNIFYKNLENDVLFINNIESAKYFYDPKEFRNILFQKIIFLIYQIQWNYLIMKKKKNLIQK